MCAIPGRGVIPGTRFRKLSRACFDTKPRRKQQTQEEKRKHKQYVMFLCYVYYSNLQRHKGKSPGYILGSHFSSLQRVEQSAEHSYEVVLVVRSVAVRRHTRFRVEGGYFPAAAIRLARFLDFSSTFRAIGRREFDAGSQELSFLDFPSNSRIIGRRRFDAKSQGTSFALWRPPKSTRQR